MNLHEYQSKELLRSYGLPVPEFKVSSKTTGIGKAAYELSPGPFVCKCQVHSGARGKAGGVVVVNTPAEAEAFAAKRLGNRLVTRQSGPHGKPVSKILIERATEAVRELYIGATIDRTNAHLTIMASESGGMSVEEIAAVLIFKNHMELVNKYMGALATLPVERNTVENRIGDNQQAGGL